MSDTTIGVKLLPLGIGLQSDKVLFAVGSLKSPKERGRESAWSSHSAYGILCSADIIWR